MKGVSGEVVASFNGKTWQPMGHVSHVEAARRFALQEICPKHAPYTQKVLTKWIDGQTIFQHQVRVGVFCEVVPLRGDAE